MSLHRVYAVAMKNVAELEKSKLKQAITGPLLFLFILGDVLGAGIYALVGKVAGEVGGAIWVPLVFALLLAMLTAGSYAELVTKYPKAGGAAVFAERAFKVPVVSFLVGFCMLAAGVTSAAGLSLAFAGDYLKPFLDVPTIAAAAVFLVLIALLNARGVKESVRANVVMTVVEVSGLVLVIVLVGMMFARGDGDASRVVAFNPEVSPAVGILAASLLAFYSFVGFETSANVAEEVRDVHRVYPKALFGALLTAGGIYVLIGLASSIAVDPNELNESSGPLLQVVQATGFGVPDWLFGLVALIAVANGALLTMIMASRLAFGMAEQALLPPSLGRVLPNRRTPWVAIMVTTAAAIALTLTGDLQSLAETVVLLLLFVFISTNTAVLVLRKDEVSHKHFRVPTVIPYMALGSCALLLMQQGAEIWLRASVLLIIGLALFYATRWISSRGIHNQQSGRRPEEGQGR